MPNTDILYVKVTHDGGVVELDPPVVRPQSNTLAVVWYCVPPDGDLAISFSEQEGTPFTEIAPQGSLIIGSGNAGPRPPGSNDYPYEIYVNGINQPGEGLVINESQGPLLGGSVSCEVPPTDPPKCTGDNQ